MLKFPMGKGGVASVMVMFLTGVIKTFNEVDAAPGNVPFGNHESDCQLADVELFQTCAIMYSGRRMSTNARSREENVDVWFMAKRLGRKTMFRLFKNSTFPDVSRSRFFFLEAV